MKAKLQGLSLCELTWSHWLRVYNVARNFKRISFRGFYSLLIVQKYSTINDKLFLFLAQLYCLSIDYSQ